MARYKGHHRISRRTKIATLGIGLAMATGVLVVVTTSGDPGAARAELADKSFFVDIEDVEPNVDEPNAERDASTGTFTVNCGNNEEGHFNADNFIAQPGVQNGAEHVHDYVGNLNSNSESNNQSLAASDTTCPNGDQSAYYWPVVRIDQNADGEEDGNEQRGGEENGNEQRGGEEATSAEETSRAEKTSGSKETSAPEKSNREAEETSESQATGKAASGGQGTNNFNGQNWQDWQNQNAKAQPGQNSDSDNLDAQRNKAKQQGNQANADCYDIASKLPRIPKQAMNQMNQQLDQLDQQVKQANKQLAQGGNSAKAAVLNQLNQQRAQTLSRIINLLQQSGVNMGDLQRWAPCAVDDDTNNGVDNGDENSDGDNSRGDDENGNQDEEEVAPGPKGANNELGINTGEIVRPTVDLTFRGSPQGEVTAMPQFLRVLTGDAKAGQNDPSKNARSTWTCEGFEDRLTDKYPICPEGSQVMRVHDFPSCWDGQNVDSADHRSHIVFPDEESGECKDGFEAVPQLRITLKYDIPVETQEAGQYAVDTFQAEERNPATDHNDFANVMGQDLMNRVVDCINGGEACVE